MDVVEEDTEQSRISKVVRKGAQATMYVFCVFLLRLYVNEQVLHEAQVLTHYPPLE